MAGALATMIASAAFGATFHATGPVGTVACTAAPPAPGAAFSGPVLQVIDERTFCVAEGPTPSAWIKVTVAGDAGSDDGADLMAAVFAHRVTCVVHSRTEDGVLARCTLDIEGDRPGERAAASFAAPKSANCPKPD